MIFTKPRLTFYSEHPEITNNYPVIPAKDYKRKWLRKSSEAYKKYKKVADNRTRVLTASKCPGIHSITNAGYILTTWCDFTIETDSSKPYDYQIYYPEGLKSWLDEIGYTKPIVSHFNMKEQPLRIPTPRSHEIVFKIWIPYTLDIPKGYEVMVIPVQYPDEKYFTALGGMLSGLAADLNIHLLWHETNGRIHIPAGTPLCQIVPMKQLKTQPVYENITKEIKQKINTKLLSKFNKF